MTVREFIDSCGRTWRAWEITPASVYPETRAEDYLADCYRDGWVVFETLDGEEKRRLCPPPHAWAERDDAHLEALLERAEVFRPRGQSRSWPPSAPADLPPSMPPKMATAVPRDADGDLDLTYLGVVRQFEVPGGGTWTAATVRQSSGRAGSVLRFSSGGRSLDLADFPKEWMDLSDEWLVELLRWGTPRKTTWQEGLPRRRYDDPRAGAEG